MFGPASGLPGLLYPRTDKPAVLASFAPEVGRCAADDPVAAGILREAACSIAEAAAAVCPPSEGSDVALTGRPFDMGEPLLDPLRGELARQLPYARQVSAAGNPLDGAPGIAAALATDRLVLPVDSRLLHVPHANPKNPDRRRSSDRPLALGQFAGVDKSGWRALTRPLPEHTTPQRH